MKVSTDMTVRPRAVPSLVAALAIRRPGHVPAPARLVGGNAVEVFAVGVRPPSIMIFPSDASSLSIIMVFVNFSPRWVGSGSITHHKSA